MRTRTRIWAAQQQVGGPRAKLVLLALADQYHRGGAPRCYSGRALARLCEIGLKALLEDLDRLQDSGLLTWSDCPDDEDGIEVTLRVPAASGTGTDPSRAAAHPPAAAA